MDLVLGWVLLSVVVGVVARARGRSGFGYFLLSLLLSPLVGLILAVALPARKAQGQYDPETPTPETHVRCPDCRELVRAEARKCKHCGVVLVPQDLNALQATAVMTPEGARGAPSVDWRVLSAVLVGVVFLAWLTTPSATSSAQAERAKLMAHCQANRDSMKQEAARKIQAGERQLALEYLQACADATQDAGMLALMDEARGMGEAVPPGGLREACRKFLVAQMRVPAGTDFGDVGRWSVVTNGDGSYSVGARHALGYHTCVIRLESGSFKSESITKML